LLIHGFFSKQSDSYSPSKESLNTSQTATTTVSSEDSSSSASNTSAATTATPPNRASQSRGKNGTTLDILKADLDWLVPILISYPKCYWIWNYRLWLLQQANERLEPDIAWQLWMGELKLVGKMLVKDSRNFHGWGYRRKVVSELESAALHGKNMVESEFEYTTKILHSPKGLSNFSAFHRRSKLIPKLLDARGADDEARRQFLEDGMLMTSGIAKSANNRRIRPRHFGDVYGLIPLHAVGMVLLPILNDNTHGSSWPRNNYTQLYRRRASRICHTPAGRPSRDAGRRGRQQVDLQCVD